MGARRLGVAGERNGRGECGSRGDRCSDEALFFPFTGEEHSPIQYGVYTHGLNEARPEQRRPGLTPHAAHATFRPPNELPERTESRA